MDEVECFDTSEFVLTPGYLLATRIELPRSVNPPQAPNVRLSGAVPAQSEFGFPGRLETPASLRAAVKLPNRL